MEVNPMLSMSRFQQLYKIIFSRNIFPAKQQCVKNTENFYGPRTDLGTEYEKHTDTVPGP